MAKEITKIYCPFGLLQVNSIMLERRQNLPSLNLEISLTVWCPPPSTSLVGFPMRLAHTTTYVHACPLLLCTF